MPPPSAAVLPLTVEFVRIVGPSELKPPASEPAVLPLTVEFVSVAPSPASKPP